ncbi:MAG: putative bifunctional diguanylate cyclase/phosphodiesterase [Burkholderiales bacterium]
MSNDLSSVNRRVLVIDDNQSIHDDFLKILSGESRDDAALMAVEAILLGETVLPTATRPSFEVDSAMQGEEGVERVRTALADGQPYAMAFVDMRMPPGLDGLETIERLWAIDHDLQIVICSAYADYEWTELVGRLGHADKLLVVKKPFEPIEVMQCASALTRKWQNERMVRRQVENLEQVVTARTQGLEAANKQLRHLATHDALTGLPNRVLMEDRLTQAMAHAERDRQTFAVALVDLDRFKNINDSLGHQAGDELLIQVARRLTSIVRSVDTVVRLGGDEFVLIFSPHISREDAGLAAQRAIELLQAPAQIAGVTIHASPSIGIAFYPDDGTAMETLVAHADAAMYCAKQPGRDKIQWYAPTMNAVTQEKVLLESELHEALASGQFELHYQPKVQISTGALHGAEALIRWRHPTRGLVSPAEFIPLAEECGLIGPIGEWTVLEACRQARAWQTAGLPPIRVAVNLSACQFRQGNLVELIGRALDQAGLDAQYLEVELTESAVMSDPEESVSILEKLSKMGVIVSVDDFGTGYSSLSYLRRFPIDKLKIDRGFINEVMSRPADASIVQAIISLAHSLRLKVIAEGVETAEQLEFLKTLGCDQYQGFHFSAALVASDFENLVRGSHNKRDSFTEDEASRTQSKLRVIRPR